MEIVEVCTFNVWFNRRIEISKYTAAVIISVPNHGTVTVFVLIDTIRAEAAGKLRSV